MEYVDGLPLDRWLRLFHPISGRLMVRLAEQLARAIAHLHESGVTHRDIKPANLIISADFSLRVMDFGVARVSTRPPEETPLTQQAKFLGTIRNTSPEMLFGEQYDHRTDLYSLGTVFYALLHGHEVFADEHQFARLVTLRKTNDPVWEPDAQNRGPIAARITALGRRLLERQPEKRPTKMDDVLVELEGIVALQAESPELPPLHGYMASALTGLQDDSREAVIFTSNKIAETAKEFELYVYEPRKATDPIVNADVADTVVYDLDRRRVLAADVVIILANVPSFGVGQELELVSSCGKPVMIVAREGSKISRMVTGSYANFIDDIVFYQSPEDLSWKLRRSLARALDVVRASRTTASQSPIRDLGDRVAQLREGAGLTSAQLARVAGISTRLLEALESGKHNNIGVDALSRIARCLKVSLASLLGDTAPSVTRTPQDASRRNLSKVARDAGWSHRDYIDLLEDYEKEVAASGSNLILDSAAWVRRHSALEEMRIKQSTLFD